MRNLTVTNLRRLPAQIALRLFVVLSAALAPLSAHAAAAKTAAAAAKEAPAMAMSASDAAELGLRLFRIVLMLLIIVFVNQMFFGAVKHITSSGNDNTVAKGRRHFASGLIGAATMLILFVIATSALTQFE